MNTAAAPDVTSRGTAPRRVTALFCSLIGTGLGQMAIGYWRRGCAWAATAVGFMVFAEVATVVTHSPRFMWAGAAGVLFFHALSAIDAFRLERDRPLPSAPAVIGGYLGMYLCFVLLALTMRATLVEAFSLPSRSMYPTLDVGDHLMVDKLTRHYARGDVAVFRYPLDPSTTYIKRVVGLGGDVVEIREGRLSINGQVVERKQVDEPCVAADDGRSCTLWEEMLDGRTWRIAEDTGTWVRDFGPLEVPAGQFFVLGDNRENSSDSRVWGPVAAPLMRGRPMFIWWSSAAGALRWDRVNTPVR
jgi:signal peptidase I